VPSEDRQQVAMHAAQVYAPVLTPSIQSWNRHDKPQALSVQKLLTVVSIGVWGSPG